jgi:hypothetical protein
MTDITLDWLTGALDVVTLGAVIVALVGSHQAKEDNRQTREEVEQDRAAADQRAHHDFQRKIALDIAEAFELAQSGAGPGDPIIRARLAALPTTALASLRLSYLPETLTSEQQEAGAPWLRDATNTVNRNRAELRDYLASLAD